MPYAKPNHQTKLNNAKPTPIFASRWATLNRQSVSSISYTPFIRFFHLHLSYTIARCRLTPFVRFSSNLKPESSCFRVELLDFIGPVHIRHTHANSYSWHSRNSADDLETA